MSIQIAAQDHTMCYVCKHHDLIKDFCNKNKYMFTFS